MGLGNFSISKKFLFLFHVDHRMVVIDSSPFTKCCSALILFEKSKEISSYSFSIWVKEICSAMDFNSCKYFFFKIHPCDGNDDIKRILLGS